MAAGVILRDGGVGICVVDPGGKADCRETETPRLGQHPQILPDSGVSVSQGLEIVLQERLPR